jgi:C-terminal processing protease CtpA/Prc
MLKELFFLQQHLQCMPHSSTGHKGGQRENKGEGAERVRQEERGGEVWSGKTRVHRTSSAGVQLRERYLKEVRMDNREETYNAIRSAIAVLDDPFTRFLEPQQYAALKRRSSGAVTGVGLEVGFGTSSGTSGDLTVLCLPLDFVLSTMADAYAVQES